jgi:hypothetical protein
MGDPIKNGPKSDSRTPEREPRSRSATIRIIAACLIRRRLLENAEPKRKRESLEANLDK